MKSDKEYWNRMHRLSLIYSNKKPLKMSTNQKNESMGAKYLIIEDASGTLWAVKPTMQEPSVKSSIYADIAADNKWQKHLQSLPPLHLDPSIKGKEGDRVDGVEQWQMEYSKHPDEEPYWIDITEKEYREQNIHIDCRIILKAVAEKETQTNYMQTIPDSHYWTNIEMLLHYLRHHINGNVPANYLIIGLQNTLNKGYQLTSPDQSQEAQKQGAEEILRDNAFMNGGNTNEQKDYYTMGFKDGYAAQPAEDWVAVEDGLPEVGKMILCYREGDTIPDSYYPEVGAYGFFNKGVWGNQEKDNWKVTHWRPLPAPPSNQNKK